MCGICGEFRFSGAAPGQVDWNHMIGLMQRRGPDDAGYFSDEICCTLGFRRLAILDRSPSGSQPMHTADGRYTLVYNGEMYNYQTLRAELEQRGVRFRSSGDTEVVLYALAEWGRAALDRFNGMFALAFFDHAQQRLFLARDHAGIKPLYYLTAHQGLFFASQYNQLMAHPWSRNLAISMPALALYFQRWAIPAPLALLENTHLLEPGCWLEVRHDGRLQHGRYYRFEAGFEPELQGSAAYEAVDAAITDAVRRQMISDVPLGTFLSGGIDSPLVTAKVQLLSNHSVKSFSIGIAGHAKDESADAKRYAEEMGVQQTLHQFTPEMVLPMLDDYIAATGEPFADYSLFPTLLVARLARQAVTVILSGDGGDEAFWGYSRSFPVLRQAHSFRLPHQIRLPFGKLKRKLGRWQSPWYTCKTIGDWYHALLTAFPLARLRQIFPDLPAINADAEYFQFDGWRQDRVAQWIRRTEFNQYLPEVLLKVDRGSMYHSLEVRVPLLDKEVLAVARQVDWQSCVDLDKNMGKIPLRQALQKHIQHQTHAKRGFYVPMEDWLRAPLKPLFEDLVLPRRAILGVPLDQSALHRLFEAHLSGRTNEAGGLWAILNLVLWEQAYRKS